MYSIEIEGVRIPMIHDKGTKVQGELWSEPVILPPIPVFIGKSNATLKKIQDWLNKIASLINNADSSAKLMHENKRKKELFDERVKDLRNRGLMKVAQLTGDDISTMPYTIDENSSNTIDQFSSFNFKYTDIITLKRTKPTYCDICQCEHKNGYMYLRLNMKHKNCSDYIATFDCPLSTPIQAWKIGNIGKLYPDDETKSLSTLLSAH